MDTSRPDLWTQPPSSKPNDDQGSSGNYGCQHHADSPSTGMNYKKRNSLNTAHTTPASTVSTTLEFPHRQTDLPPPTTRAGWVGNLSIGSASGNESGFLQGGKNLGGTATICGLQSIPSLCHLNKISSTSSANNSLHSSSSTPVVVTTFTPVSSGATTSDVTTSSYDVSQAASLSPLPPSTYPLTNPLPETLTAILSTTDSMPLSKSSSSSASTSLHDSLSFPPSSAAPNPLTLFTPTLTSQVVVPSSSARTGSNSIQISRTAGVIIGVLGGVMFLLLVALFLRFRRQKIAQHARRQGNDVEQPNPSLSGSVSPLIYRYQTTQNQSDRQSVTSSSFEHLAYYEGNGSGADIQTSDDNSVLARQRRDAIISILDSESSIGIPLDILSRSQESQHVLGVERVDGVAF